MEQLSPQNRLERLAGDVKKWHNINRRFQAMVEKIGTDADTAPYREVLLRTQRDLNISMDGLVKQVTADVKGAPGVQGVPSAYARNMHALGQRAEAQRKALGDTSTRLGTKLKAFPHAIGVMPGAAAASSGGGVATSASAGRGHQQQQVQLVQGGSQLLANGTAEVYAALAAERAQQAVAIAQESAELRDIMQDLSVLVHGQSEQIRQMDDNVTVAVHRTTKGVE
jgi:hypothetical protein